MIFSMKSQFKERMTGLLVLTALLMAGCSIDATPGMGDLKVKLHDAPANYEEVNIFIERVEVNNTEGEDGWQVISEPNESFDILELTNGNFELLADVELEEGFYPQIRLIVNADSNSVVIDGESYGLFIPSGAQTGVKLNVDIEIREGEEYTLLLDFDAERSVVKTGQAPFPGYLLKPVIRASNEAETGNISGIVSPFEARAAVYAIVGEDTLSTTYADEENGEFLLMSLEEGSYDVAIEPREDGFVAVRIEDVEVETGETTDLGTIELDSE
jgi:hypothetical protein